MKCSFSKPISLLTLVCIQFISTWGQSCLSGGIVFSRQTQIDSFPMNYPGCTTIAGTVLIKEAIAGNITRLDSLIQVKQVSRAFTISDNSNLVNLKGLNNLESVNANFSIGNNKELSGLNDLNNLKSVTRDFGLGGSPKLLSLNGLNRLKKVGGLLIADLPIQSLSGLDSLTTITNQLNIANCNELVSLGGIGTRVLAAGEFWFYSNPKVTDFNNLPVIKSLKRLNISYNQNLLSLDGLDSLTLADQIEVESNPKLTSLLGFKSLKSVPVQLSIRVNNELVNLEGLDSLKNCGRLLIENNPKLVSIESLKGLTKAEFIGITNNHELLSLSGLDNVDPQTLIEFEIWNNYALDFCHVKSICAFLSLYPFSDPNVMNNFDGCNSTAEIREQCGIILPVTITGFKARQLGQQVTLSWRTLQERNNKGFELQRSSNAAAWQRVGFVNGHVNSAVPQDYAYTDAKPVEGMVYYRLKQVDLDGKYSFSDVVSTKVSENSDIILFPNPASDYVEIYGIKDGQIKVVDANGRVLISQSANRNARINLSGLNKGLYFVEIASGNTISIQKLLKQ